MNTKNHPPALSCARVTRKTRAPFLALLNSTPSPVVLLVMRRDGDLFHGRVIQGGGIYVPNGFVSLRLKPSALQKLTVEYAAP